MKRAIFIVTMCSGWSMAVCPQFTYPENHKLDVELNNICSNVRYPLIDYGTANIMVITSATINQLQSSSLTVTQQATIASMTVSGQFSLPSFTNVHFLGTNGAGVVVSTTGVGKIIATYISSGNFQTSSANSTFIPCPPYSSSFSVTLGDYIYITLTVQIDTNQAGGQFHADLFQDNTNLNGGGVSGGGWLQVFNPSNRELQTVSGALWYKPTDSSSHNYQLKFNSPNGGTVFCGNTDDYWIAQEIQIP